MSNHNGNGSNTFVISNEGGIRTFYFKKHNKCVIDLKCLSNGKIHKQQHKTRNVVFKKVGKHELRIFKPMFNLKLVFEKEGKYNLKVNNIKEKNISTYDFKLIRDNKKYDMVSKEIDKKMEKLFYKNKIVCELYSMYKINRDSTLLSFVEDILHYLPKKITLSMDNFDCLKEIVVCDICELLEISNAHVNLYLKIANYVNKISSNKYFD
jgi:hypothetical protein